MLPATLHHGANRLRSISREQTDIVRLASTDRAASLKHHVRLKKEVLREMQCVTPEEANEMVSDLHVRT